MRILIVEDDSAMARQIETQLRSAGFITYQTDLGEEAVELGKLYKYDIISLDLQLPDTGGLEVIRILRAAMVHTPILVLSGNNTVEAKVKALSMGADDYMTKPYHMDELVARLNAVLRRSKGHARDILTVGKIVFDPFKGRVEVAGIELYLPDKEYRLLKTLMFNKNVVQSREQLLSEMNDGRISLHPRTADVHMSKLRRKLTKALGGEDYIETISKRGYLLREPRTTTED